MLRISESSDGRTFYLEVEANYKVPEEGRGQQDAINFFMGQDHVNALDSLISGKLAVKFSAKGTTSEQREQIKREIETLREERESIINKYDEDFLKSEVETVYIFEIPCEQSENPWWFLTDDINEAQTAHPNVKYKVASLDDLDDYAIIYNQTYSHSPVWLDDGLYQFNHETSSYDCLLKTEYSVH